MTSRTLLHNDVDAALAILRISDDVSYADDILTAWETAGNTSLVLAIRQHDILARFIAFIARHAPYLDRLLTLHPDIFSMFMANEADVCLRTIINSIEDSSNMALSYDAACDNVRIAKQQLSLMLALVDLAGIYQVHDVTRALSDFADACVCFVLEHATRANAPKDVAREKGILSKRCGMVAFAMGKMGGYELNYSSDIDLIVIYDPDKLAFLAAPARNRFAVRVTQQVVAMLQDRRQTGYVFRVDLRLRPDPASTGLAVALDNALYYYERVGQNWERSALIKARICAGDQDTGARFLQGIKPFIWRTHLDFAAIDDILSIKRQMQHDQDDTIDLYAHNIKIGYGGIREIEFLASLHQLIWGGRIRPLRTPATCDVIALLPHYDFITDDTAATLTDAYAFLRMVEHRLQMRNDQQTHSLPDSDEALTQLSEFCLMDSPDAFKNILSDTLNYVHDVFCNAFREGQPLGDVGGKLVFTGVEHDAETLCTLQRMGFEAPQVISHALQQWHKGTKRCTRSKRARELLTELAPVLLKDLSITLQPDKAFARFDAFLDALPAGVQPFSLFNANPELLTLITNITGNAPILASQLSSYPQLLDVVLDYHGGRYATDVTLWSDELSEWLGVARDEEEMIRFFTIFKMEHEFLIGLRLLQQHVTPLEASWELSALADVMIKEAITIVTQQLQERYADEQDLRYAVIGLGKLGTQELMLGSDLDVMMVYQVEDGDSDTRQYYNRLTSRVLRLLAHPLKTGALYDMDTKLRPYGTQGAVAVELDAFKHYYSNDAWVVENLALLQGRIVYASTKIAPNVEHALRGAQAINIAAPAIADHISDVRKKISEQFYSNNPWDIKYVWGGLMDLEWIVKAWLADTYHMSADDTIHRTSDHLKHLYTNEIMDKVQYDVLSQAHRLFHTVLSYLRLCHGDVLEEELITDELKILLLNITNIQSFRQLRQELVRTQAQIYHLYQNLSYM